MAALGPFEPAPRLAAGVSGGADSMALALLAYAWVRERGGSLLALVVDHGLRRASGDEAAATVARLAASGIPSRLLRLQGLARGPGLAARARAARAGVLTDACTEAGILHLLLGHHAADQAETVLIRALGGSGPVGLAGMLPLVETATLRILRPLLAVAPVRLRALLAGSQVAWVEDPSNTDRAALRARLRWLRRDRDGAGMATVALVASAEAAARHRVAEETMGAAELAACASIRPEGFALLSPRLPGTAALRGLLQAIAGSPFAPPASQVVTLLAAPAGATLTGVRLLPAGRLGSGWLLVREAAAMAPPVPAGPDAVWDGRFRLGRGAAPQEGTTFGAVGGDAAKLRRHSTLPAAVLRTLPALRRGATLLAVPHLHYPDRKACEGFDVVFSPPRPAVAAPYRFGDA